MTGKPDSYNPINFTVRNNLKLEKREINVYHHSSRTSHIISYNQALSHDLKLVDENDYLHVSVVRGPGRLKNPCIVELPSFMNFRFKAAGEVSLHHSNRSIHLHIPPGPPVWELDMNLSSQSMPSNPLPTYRISVNNGGDFSDGAGNGTGGFEPAGVDDTTMGGTKNDRPNVFSRMSRRFAGWLQAVLQIRG